MTALSPAKLYAGPYPALKAQLYRTLLPRIENHPLEEKIILLPSNYIAEDIYRGLTEHAGRPVLHVRAITLLDFARRLLKHRNIMVREIDSITRAVLLADVVEGLCRGGKEKSSLKKIAGKRGFVRALLRLFGEFEEGMISSKEIESLLVRRGFIGQFPNPRKIKELLAIYMAFLGRVEKAGLKTRSTIVREASEGFEVPGYPFRAWLFGFYDFTRLQWVLVEKLLGSGLNEDVFFPLPAHHGKKEVVIDAFSGLRDITPPWYSYAQETLWQFLRQFDGNMTILDDERPNTHSARTSRRALFQEPPEGPSSDLPFTLISAPHGPGELRAVARLINAESDGGSPPGRRGVLFRELDEDTVIEARRVFQEFKLPFEVAWEVPLIRTSAAKALIGLMKLPLMGFPRRETVDTLTSPSLIVSRLHPRGEEFSPLWDHLTKKLGVTGGDHWNRKLKAFIEKSAAALERIETGDESEEEDTSRRIALTRREVAGVQALAAVVRSLMDALEPVTELSSFASLSAMALDLFESLIQSKSEEKHVPFQDRLLRRIPQILIRLGELDSLGISFPSPENGVLLVEKIFQEETVPLHAPGFARRDNLIVAGDITSLRGVDFDQIFILNINEGIWPRKGKDVSLLKEEEREIFLGALKEPGLPPPLPKMRENLPEEKLLFCLPLLMGSDVRSLSFRRSDMAGTKLVPSPLLVDLVSRFRGTDVLSQGLSDTTVGRKYLEFPRQLKDRFTAPGRSSVREVVISSFLDIPHPGGTPTMAANTFQIVGRSLHTCTQWQEGRELAPDPERVKELTIPAGHISHTFLDTYILCPYRAYLRYALKLEPLPEPEEVFTLGRLEMGLIVHRALYLLYTSGEKDFPPALIEDSVERSIQEYGEGEPLGLEGLRKITRKELLGIISDFISWETRAAGEFIPERFECKFGFGNDHPVTIDIEGRGVPLIGKIDRIDRKGTALRVIDYKLSRGSKYDFMEEKIAMGIMNQIPLYALAAKKMYESRGIPVTEVTGGYILLRRTEKEGYLIEAHIDPEGQLASAWEKSLSLLLQSLTHRAFPPFADRDFKVARWNNRYCDHCEYADICRVSPMTSGNEDIARSLKEKIPLLYPGLSWHLSYRTVSP